MEAVKHNAAFAKKVGVPQSVGADFSEADKGLKFNGGPRQRPDLQKIASPKTEHGKTALFSRGGEMKESKAMAKKEIAFMQKKGAPASMVKHEKAEYGMKSGGITKAKMGAVRTAAPSKDGIASKGKTKGTQIKMSGSKPLGMKKGGKAC